MLICALGGLALLIASCLLLRRLRPHAFGELMFTITKHSWNDWNDWTHWADWGAFDRLRQDNTGGGGAERALASARAGTLAPIGGAAGSAADKSAAALLVELVSFEALLEMEHDSGVSTEPLLGWSGGGGGGSCSAPWIQSYPLIMCPAMSDSAAAAQRDRLEAAQLALDAALAASPPPSPAERSGSVLGMESSGSPGSRQDAGRRLHVVQGALDERFSDRADRGSASWFRVLTWP